MTINWAKRAIEECDLIEKLLIKHLKLLSTNHKYDIRLTEDALMHVRMNRRGNERWLDDIQT